MNALQRGTGQSLFVNLDLTKPTKNSEVNKLMNRFTVF